MRTLITWGPYSVHYEESQLHYLVFLFYNEIFLEQQNVKKHLKTRWGSSCFCKSKFCGLAMTRATDPLPLLASPHSPIFPPFPHQEAQ